MDPDNGSPNAPVTEPGSAHDWESDDNPYKGRFNDYRVEADRRATKLSTYEQSLEDLRSGDPTRQSAAADALGLTLVQDEPDPGYVDPYDELLSRQEALEQRLAERDRSQQERDQSTIVETRLTSLALDEDDKNWVLARAVALPPGDDGLPNVAAAYEQLTARDNARIEAAMKEWAEKKRTGRGIAPGTTATEQKNIMDMTDEERVEWAVRRLDDA